MSTNNLHGGDKVVPFLRRRQPKANARRFTVSWTDWGSVKSAAFEKLCQIIPNRQNQRQNAIAERRAKTRAFGRNGFIAMGSEISAKLETFYS
jgi:hypothetical protein